SAGSTLSKSGTWRVSTTNHDRLVVAPLARAPKNTRFSEDVVSTSHKRDASKRREIGLTHRSPRVEGVPGESKLRLGSAATAAVDHHSRATRTATVAGSVSRVRRHRCWLCRTVARGAVPLSLSQFIVYRASKKGAIRYGRCTVR